MRCALDSTADPPWSIHPLCGSNHAVEVIDAFISRRSPYRSRTKCERSSRWIAGLAQIVRADVQEGFQIALRCRSSAIALLHAVLQFFMGPSRNACAACSRSVTSRAIA